MQTRLLSMALCLIYTCSRATDNSHHLSMTTGRSSKFILTQETEPTVLLTQNKFCGFDWQMPAWWETTIVATVLYHAKSTENEKLHDQGQVVRTNGPTVVLEGSVRKVVIKPYTRQTLQPSIYIKLGGWLRLSIVPTAISKFQVLVNGGSIGGIGLQVSCHRILLDCSFNSLLAHGKNMRYSWYTRGGIGFRL